jgi:hypothetical protein
MSRVNSAPVARERFSAEPHSIKKQCRGSRGLGERPFRQELRVQLRERMGAKPYGAERTDTAEAIAKQIVKEDLNRVRWPVA